MVHKLWPRLKVFKNKEIQGQLVKSYIIVRKF